MKKILSFAALLFAFASLSWAYNFSAVAPTGQTLYYTISGSNVSVTYPGSSVYAPWDSYTEPTGALTIPSTVTYNSQTYSVTSIGNDAFRGCSGLTSLTIPNSVTSIGGEAFYGCSGLTSVTIPNSVTSIGEVAFDGCRGLTSVTFNAINCTTMGSYSYPAFYGCSNLASLTIGDSVQRIPDHAFSGCIGLTSVTIGNSVTSIGNDAFRDCIGLTSVTIPNSVTSIGGEAFYDCRGLTTVTIPNSVTSIGSWAFRDCIGLTSLTIGNSVTSIGNRAFYGCSGLTSVTFNAINCTTMGNSSYPVFFGCTHVALTIGDSVQRIPDYAFYGGGFASVTIGNSVTAIGDDAFAYCSLGSVTIPNSVTSIGYEAFAHGGLTSLTIGNSVTSIGNRAFYDCSGLTSVTFNAINCTTTGSSSPAFSGCTHLASLTIGDSVQRIPDYAFRYWRGLTSVTFNANNCTTMGSSSAPAFDGCTNLASLTIGDSVQRIPDYAFYGCSGITSVSIPNSVTAIGDYAFYHCGGFRGVLNINPRVIGNGAFAGQTQLTNIKLGNAVDSVMSNAFSGCNKVIIITLGSGLRYIGSEAFSGMERMTNITSKAENAPYVAENNAFSSIPTNTPITIPCNALSNYQYAFGWSQFTNFQSTMLYALNVVSADPSRGGVTIITQPTCDNAQAQFQANAYNDYRFDHWSDGNTDNPRYLVLTSDTTLIAYFESTQGIDDATDKAAFDISIIGSSIVVEGIANETVRLFDCMGRCLQTLQGTEPCTLQAPAPGVYMLQVGNHPAQKVVVVR